MVRERIVHDDIITERCKVEGEKKREREGEKGEEGERYEEWNYD